MMVKRKNLTSYIWNEHALRNLMVEDMEAKHGIDILPSAIKRVIVPGHPEIAQFSYTIAVDPKESS